MPRFVDRGEVFKVFNCPGLLTEVKGQGLCLPVSLDSEGLLRDVIPRVVDSGEQLSGLVHPGFLPPVSLFAFVC